MCGCAERSIAFDFNQSIGVCRRIYWTPAVATNCWWNTDISSRTNELWKGKGIDKWKRDNRELIKSTFMKKE